MSENNVIFDESKLKTQFEKLASWQIPFGKYSGRVLIDLPEPYLLWFEKQGWPDGELGELLALALEIRVVGSEGLIKKLK